MNLEELKQRIKPDMTDIYSRIKRNAEDGESYATFGHGYIDQEDEISEAQVDILQEQGYTVLWNRSCLWYEVSGWK